MQPRSDLLAPARSLDELKEAARGCTACPLFENATQTVFGEGPRQAPLMLVGEQPGDVEDRQGRPFVGPAGQLLDWAPHSVTGSTAPALLGLPFAANLAPRGEVGN